MTWSKGLALNEADVELERLSLPVRLKLGRNDRVVTESMVHCRFMLPVQSFERE